MSDQPDLFASTPPNPAMAARIARIEAKRPRKTIEERCADFDRDHPEVYAEIERLALDAFARGRRRLGIGQLVEVARWNLSTTARDDGYKLNNDFRSRWVRRLIADHPEFKDAFELRELKAR